MSDALEKIWLERIAGGDEQAFRELYDQYSPRIYSLGVHITHSSILAQELVQEIFEKLWNKRSNLYGIDNLPAYIKAMTRNTASNHLKRMAHEQLVLRSLVNQQTAEEPGAGAGLDRLLIRRLWKKALDSLSPKVREVYLLSRIEGLKNASIAEKMGISIYTVKEYLKKALSVIRKELDGRMDVLILAALLLLC